MTAEAFSIGANGAKIGVNCFFTPEVWVEFIELLELPRGEANEGDFGFCFFLFPMRRGGPEREGGRGFLLDPNMTLR